MIKGSTSHFMYRSDMNDHIPKIGAKSDKYSNLRILTNQLCSHFKLSMIGFVGINAELINAQKQICALIFNFISFNF